MDKRIDSERFNDKLDMLKMLLDLNSFEAKERNISLNYFEYKRRILHQFENGHFEQSKKKVESLKSSLENRFVKIKDFYSDIYELLSLAFDDDFFTKGVLDSNKKILYLLKYVKKKDSYNKEVFDFVNIHLVFEGNTMGYNRGSELLEYFWRNKSPVNIRRYFEMSWIIIQNFELVLNELNKSILSEFLYEIEPFIRKIDRVELIDNINENYDSLTGLNDKINDVIDKYYFKFVKINEKIGGLNKEIIDLKTQIDKLVQNQAELLEPIKSPDSKPPLVKVKYLK